VPGCESIDPAPCDVIAAPCQLRLHQMAACLRDDDAGEPPAIEVVSAADYAEYLRSRYRPRPVPDHEEEALTLFDLIEPGALDPEARVEDAAAFYAGVYSRDTKSITLIEHDPPLDAARASVLLVHELVHALQDREIDLGAFVDAFATSFDAAIATRSVFEGEATLHQDRYATAVLTLDPHADLSARFAQAIAEDEQEQVASASPYLTASRAFPYAWGAHYMHSFWREGGMEAVADRYTAPPRSTALVMATATAPADPFTPTSVSAPIPSDEWSLFSTNTFGALSLFLVLARASDDLDRARELALAWRGDSFAIYREMGGSEGTAAVWSIAVATAAEAAAIAALLAAGGEARADGAIVVAARTNGLHPLAFAFPP
jgi:hypothetical protein